MKETLKTTEERLHEDHIKVVENLQKQLATAKVWRALGFYW